MDEDDDVVFENSPLYEHLLGAGFQPQDFLTSSHPGIGCNTNKNSGSTTKSRLRRFLDAWFPNLVSEWHNLIRLDVLKEKGPVIIASSGILNQEDFDFLQNFIENRQDDYANPSQSSLSWTSKFPCKIGALTATAACLTATFGITGPAFLCSIPVSFWALKQQSVSTHVTKLECLLLSTTSIRSLLHKSLQFLQEMELLEKGFMLPGLATYLCGKTNENHRALHCRSLRDSVNLTIYAMYLATRDALLAIRKTIPLPGGLDNESHYLLCSAVIDLSPDVTLFQLKSSYRSLLNYISEYFRRVALGYLESLLYYTSVRQIESQWSAMISKFSSLEYQLRTVHNYYTAWKVRETTTDNVKPNTSDEKQTASAAEMARQSLDRHLRATVWLLEDWTAENTQLEGTIAKEVQAINACYELWLQALKPVQVKSLATHCSQGLAETAEVVIQPNVLGEAVPLFGPWNDLGEDQVLEAEVTDEQIQPDDDYDDIDVEYYYLSREERRQRREQAKANSRHLLSELQNVLQYRAKEWRQREAKALGKPLELVSAELSHESANLERKDYETGWETCTAPIEEKTVPEAWDQEAMGTGNEQVLKTRAKNSEHAAFGFMPNFAQEIRLAASLRMVETETLGDSSDDEHT